MGTKPKKGARSIRSNNPLSLSNTGTKPKKGDKKNRGSAIPVMCRVCRDPEYKCWKEKGE